MDDKTEAEPKIVLGKHYRSVPAVASTFIACIQNSVLQICICIGMFCSANLFWLYEVT